MKTKLLCFIGFLFVNIVFCQSILSNNKCDIKVSIKAEKLFSIKASDLKCITEKSNEKLMVYIYEYWCKPCNEKILEIKEFANKNDINLIVLVIEKEGTKNSKKDEEILTKKYDIENIGILSDDYGNNMRKKYKAFLNDISIEDNNLELSKIILFNRLGKIIYISKLTDDINEIGKHL